MEENLPALPEKVEKSADQIRSEQILDAAINDTASDTGQESNQSEQPSGVDPVGALQGLLSLIPIGLAITGLKNTAEVWNDGVCRGIAQAAIPVMQKHVWGQRVINFLQTGGGIEEFALLMALGPVMLSSYQAYQLDTKPVEKEVKGEEIKTPKDGVHDAGSPLGSTFKFES